jgi:hypothetical protein
MPIILNKKEIVNTYLELGSQILLSFIPTFPIENPLHGIPQSAKLYALRDFILFPIFFTL